MATITFNGPTVEDANVVVTKVVTIPDATFISLQQAICILGGYVSGSKADFVVQKAVDNWHAAAVSYARSKAEADAAAGIATAVAAIQTGFGQVIIS